jgi:undecaprenyl-diphosphatase
MPRKFIYAAVVFCLLFLPLMCSGAQLTAAQGILSGVVQGVTEFLPISSSAHLIILETFFDSHNCEPAGDIWRYHVLLQFASIFPVFAFYRGRAAQMVKGVFLHSATGLQTFAKLLVAFLPTAIFGILLGNSKNCKLDVQACALPLLIGGICVLIFEFTRKTCGTKAISDLQWSAALFIGLLQSFALIPGVSRSLASLLGSLLVGLSPCAAVEFSFLLGAGTVCAAGIYAICFDSAFSIIHSMPISSVLYGMIVAFICAFVAIHFMLHILQKYSLLPFAIYRIALGVFILIFSN